MTIEMYGKCLNPDMVIYGKLPQDVKDVLADLSNKVECLSDSGTWHTKSSRLMHYTSVYRIHPDTKYDTPKTVTILMGQSTQTRNVLSNGVTLIPKRENTCNGCYWSPNGTCIRVPRYGNRTACSCTRHDRRDDTSIVWVEEPQKLEPVVEYMYWNKGDPVPEDTPEGCEYQTVGSTAWNKEHGDPSSWT